MYGVKQDHEGNEIQADNGAIRPEAGFVDNCQITYVGPAKDQDGNSIEGQAEIVFKQPSGAEVRHRIFKPSKSDNPNAPSLEDQIDILNKKMKHICTKMVDEDTFHQKTQADSFEDFIKNVKSLVEEHGKDKKFRVAFTYKKNGWIDIRMFPNFIENMEIDRNETTLNWNPKYDNVENPKEQASEETEVPEGSSEDPEW